MYRFFVADEETLFCCGLDFILRELFVGARVTTCFERSTLIQTLENSDKSFDIIVIDLQMAMFGNFTHLKELTSRHPDSPVIIIGKDNDSEMIRNCMLNGANGYILKSSSMQTLKLAFSLVLSGEIYVPPEPFVSQRPIGNIPPNQLYAQDNLLGKLTRRQYDVLVLMMDGQPNKQIALNLGLLENTVKAHVKAVLKKLRASNRTQAVVIATSLGLSSNPISRRTDSAQA